MLPLDREVPVRTLKALERDTKAPFRVSSHAMITLIGIKRKAREAARTRRGKSACRDVDVLDPFRTIRIMTPADFLDIVAVS